jgi:single-strand DNA-binding protein
MNTMFIMGRLTSDPEVRKFENGSRVAKFTVAVDDFRSKEDRADFISVEAWGQRADFVEKYNKKGLMTVVQGHVKVESYVDKEGVKRKSFSLIAEEVQPAEWPESDQEQEAKPAGYSPADRSAENNAENTFEQDEEMGR